MNLLLFFLAGVCLWFCLRHSFGRVRKWRVTRWISVPSCFVKSRRNVNVMKCTLCNDREASGSGGYTQRCDRCWELETRIEAAPRLSMMVIKKLIEREEAEGWGKTLDNKERQANDN